MKDAFPWDSERDWRVAGGRLADFLPPLLHASDAAKRDAALEPERLDDRRGQTGRARGHELADEEITVAVDDHARHPVALAVHHAVGLQGRREDLPAHRQRLVDATLHQGRVDALLLQRERAGRGTSDGGL